MTLAVRWLASPKRSEGGLFDNGISETVRARFASNQRTNYRRRRASRQYRVKTLLGTHPL
jgi:hypothetical protein